MGRLWWAFSSGVLALVGGFPLTDDRHVCFLMKGLDLLSVIVRYG